jgi:phosphoribosylanthranilate isomerase
LLTSETKPEEIIAHYKKVYTSTIQLVDALEGRDYQTLRTELPGVKLVQVIHVLDENSVAEALEISESVDAILLDSGNPNLNIKELGGTGRIHNWQLSRQIREQVKVPVFLAGGLNSNNVREAIETVQPFGIDLCSGVRSVAHLDKRKLEAFFNELAKI